MRAHPPFPMPSPKLLPRLAVIGRLFFVAAIVFFGLQHLIYGEFVTRLLPPWPTWVPGRVLWPYVLGLALIAAGVLLESPRFARRTGLIVGATTLVSALLLALPAAVADASIGIAWTNAGKALALAGSAWIVAAFTAPGSSTNWDRWYVAIGRGTLAGFFVLAGIQHFLWAKFVAMLVPAWIPGAMFWTYFAGIALIAGGIGLWIPATARWAAWLSALMIFTWVLVLHVPRALSDLGNANEATAVFEALAFSGAALLLALGPRTRHAEFPAERHGSSTAPGR